MLRGITTFKCDNCGNTFKDFDFEYQATVFTQPMRCPKCGSMHTMPKSMFPFWSPSKGIYRQIWENLDKNK